MRKILLGLLALAIPIGYAYGQQNVNPTGTSVGGFAGNRSTVNNSLTLGTSNTFQLILPSNTASNTVRQALTIENNNTTANCWVFFGVNTGATVSAATSTAALLLPGGAYQRYWPFVPSDPIWSTCNVNNGTLYVEVQ